VDLVRSYGAASLTRTLAHSFLVRTLRHADPDWAEFDPDVAEELEKAYQQAKTANDGTPPRCVRNH
jgi:hypothetical protein